jgi:hypothetical protein
LTELERAEAILGFGSIGPNRLLGQYGVKWGLLFGWVCGFMV